MRESTEAHVVWLALAKKYSTQHFRTYRPGTRSFDDLTTDELRAWVRKRLVADQIWRARRARPHSRTIHGAGETTVLTLVPGTSWLLVSREDGSVCYYNLDSQVLGRFPLTPPSSTAEELLQTVQDLDVHVDEGTSRLEFKLVVHKTSKRICNKSELCPAHT